MPASTVVGERATDAYQETRGQVAVKTVSRKLLTAKLLENLQTEIKILKALNHKHITRLVEIIVSNTSPLPARDRRAPL